MTDKRHSGGAVDDFKNERALVEGAIFVFDGDVEAMQAGGEVRGQRGFPHMAAGLCAHPWLFAGAGFAEKIFRQGIGAERARHD